MWSEGEKHSESPVMTELWLKVKLVSFPSEIALSTTHSRIFHLPKLHWMINKCVGIRHFLVGYCISFSLRAHAQGYQSSGHKARSNPASPQTFLSVPMTPLHRIVHFKQVSLGEGERNAAWSDSLIND